MYENMMDLSKNHRIDRHAVTHVKCLRCGLVQPKSATCQGCNKDFAVYYCEICSFYDDMGAEKQHYHCEKCGICKTGGRENSYHCDICDLCYKIPCDNHVCVPDRMK